MWKNETFTDATIIFHQNVSQKCKNSYFEDEMLLHVHCTLGCVLFSVFEISKTTVGHKCSLVRKVEKWFWIENIFKIEVAPSCVKVY